MPVFPPFSGSNPPFSIQKVSHVAPGAVDVTLRLSLEMAEQPTLLAAPLMRDLPAQLRHTHDGSGS